MFKRFLSVVGLVLLLLGVARTQAANLATDPPTDAPTPGSFMKLETYYSKQNCEGQPDRTDFVKMWDRKSTTCQGSKPADVTYLKDNRGNVIATFPAGRILFQMECSGPDKAPAKLYTHTVDEQESGPGWCKYDGKEAIYGPSPYYCLITPGNHVYPESQSVKITLSECPTPQSPDIGSALQVRLRQIGH